MMKKRNMAVAMAAVTVATTAAPAFAAQATETLDGTVVSVSNAEKMGALKAEVKGLLDTKYSETAPLMTVQSGLGSGAAKGKCVYTITAVANVNGTQQAAANIDSIRDLEKEIAKLEKEGDFLNITVVDKGHKEVDGEIVNWETTQYAKDGSDLPTTVATYATSVTKDVAAKTTEIVMLNNAEPMYVKAGDDVLDTTAPIWLTDDFGNYIDKDGKVIDFLDADGNPVSGADENAKLVAENGVVVGFQKAQDALEADATADNDKEADRTYGIKFAAVNEVEMKASELYDTKGKRLTSTGNKLKQYIRDYNAKSEGVGVNNDIQITAAANKLSLTVEIPTNPAEVMKVKAADNKFAKLTITGTAAEITALHTAIGLNNSTGEVSEFSTLAGRTRIETAVEVSKNHFIPNGTTAAGKTAADAVVLVNGDAKADGLAATPFAVLENAPILLTNKDSVPTEVMDEIKRLGVQKVFVIGGEGVIDTAVEDQLEAKFLDVERIKGKDRAATSLEIAKKIDEKAEVDNVFIAGGYAEADAMSIASIAANKDLTVNGGVNDGSKSGNVAPILLTPQSKELTDAQVSWLKTETQEESGTPNHYIVGGEGAVSEKVEEQLAKSVKGDVERLKGKRRQDTNSAVVKEFFATVDKLYVAKSDDKGLVDALAAGVVAANNDAPVILATEDLSAQQESDFTAMGDKATNIVEVGYGIASTVMEKLNKIFK